MKNLIDKIFNEEKATADEFYKVLTGISDAEYLFSKAREKSRETFGNSVYIRGLIEFTSYCKNDCYYCGLRRGNRNAQRYRLTKDEILQCCKNGYEAGFRTFVLQGGEDMHYTDEIMCDIISTMRNSYPDCAITLSVGEKSRETYQKYYDAGANRFLLRHETATPCHYSALHPENMTLETRMECLKSLREIGFQTGVGFMVGSPFQTDENIIADLMFIQDFKPHMIGVGPFIPHKDTPFFDKPHGSVEKTLVILALLRLTNPKALIPSTTALGTVEKDGRQKGILAGANVVMPNLSPVDVRSKYLLYNDKLCTDSEAYENRKLLEADMEKIGYKVVLSRGDSPIKTM